MPVVRRPSAVAKQRRPAAAVAVGHGVEVKVKRFRFPCGREVKVAAPCNATCPLLVFVRLKAVL